MYIIETCPKCGHDLSNEVVDTFPPIYCKVCYHCGWRWEEKQEEVKRVPFQPDSTNKSNLPGVYDSAFDKTVCRTCPNNPANGGSGICNCTLGQMNITY